MDGDKLVRHSGQLRVRIGFDLLCRVGMGVAYLAHTVAALYIAEMPSGPMSECPPVLFTTP